MLPCTIMRAISKAFNQKNWCFLQEACVIGFCLSIWRAVAFETAQSVSCNCVSFVFHSGRSCSTTKVFLTATGKFARLCRAELLLRKIGWFQSFQVELFRRFLFTWPLRHKQMRRFGGRQKARKLSLCYSYYTVFQVTTKPCFVLYIRY